MSLELVCRQLSEGGPLPRGLLLLPVSSNNITSQAVFMPGQDQGRCSTVQLQPVPRPAPNPPAACLPDYYPLLSCADQPQDSRPCHRWWLVAAAAAVVLVVAAAVEALGGGRHVRQLEEAGCSAACATTPVLAAAGSATTPVAAAAGSATAGHLGSSRESIQQRAKEGLALTVTWAALGALLLAGLARD